METVVRADAHPSSGLAGDSAGPLGRASTRAHAAVDAIAGSVDAAARRAEPALGWLADKGKGFDDAGRKAVAETCGYVAANPVKSVGIAMAAGLLLGAILLRR